MVPITDRCPGRTLLAAALPSQTQESSVTNQFPLEPNTDPTEGDGSTSPAPRTPSLSIYTRREPTTTPVDAGAPPPVPTPRPAAEEPFPGLVTTIGRLSHVPAADLWPTAGAMASWLAATPSALT